MRIKLSILIVFFVILFSGCFQETKTPEIAKPAGLSLKSIQPVKEPEGVPEKFLLPLLPWKLLKGDEGNRMFYPSYIPRKPEILFKVEKDVYLSGALPVSVPLAEDDKVYVASRYKAYALDLNGSVAWEKKVYDEFYRFIRTYGLGKHFYIGTSSTPGAEKKPWILALNKESGAVEWWVEIGEKGSKVTSNLLVANGKVCAGTSDGSIACINEDGELLWEKKVDGIVRGLAYGDGTLFVTTENGNKLFALNIENGKEEWVYEYGLFSTPAYVNGKVIVISNGEIIAVSEGKELWRRDLGVGADVNTNSFLAVTDNRIYVARTIGERPLQLYALDLDGNVVGNFTMQEGEYPGIPLATKDVVVLPVKKDYEYSKIYLLWKGMEKLYELKVLESGEVWMPKVSAAYGEIYIAVRVPDIIYKLADKHEPLIKEIKAELFNETLIVKATLQDEESAIYKALVVYSINGSEWMYKEMEIGRRYFMEPIGGYGLSEESYEAKIPVASNFTIEFYVVAIDNVGNYNLSKVYGYKVVSE